MHYGTSLAGLHNPVVFTTPLYSLAILALDHVEFTARKILVARFNRLKRIRLKLLVPSTSAPDGHRKLTRFTRAAARVFRSQRRLVTWQWIVEKVQQQVAIECLECVSFKIRFAKPP